MLTYPLKIFPFLIFADEELNPKEKDRQLFLTNKS